MEQVEKKVEEAKANASNNSDEIESLKFEIKEQSDKVSKQFETISKLESEIEELKKKSLRKTLIFKNIKYQQANKNSWSDTKSVLIDQISRVLPETTKEEISNNIERAHRVRSKGTSSNGSPPYLKDGQLGVFRKSQISHTGESKWSITGLRFPDVFKVTHALSKPSPETLA